MTAKEYESSIKKQMQFDADTMKSFQTCIQICAQILEERDRVQAEYIAGGQRPVIEFTSDRGAVNLKTNPLLKEWQELNAQALLYLRDLGINPAGRRKLQGAAITEKGTRSAKEILTEIRSKKK